jgi:hypothetical protein
MTRSLGFQNPAPVSSVRHYISLAFPFFAKARYMVALTGYFDETGSYPDSTSRFSGIAGIISTPELWGAFETKWQSILDREGLEYFHMTDFAVSRGQFSAGWSDNEERRRRVLAEVWNAIEELDPIFVGAMISLEHYRKEINEHVREFMRDAYVWAYTYCMGEVFELLKSPSASDVVRVATVFDDRRGFRGLLADQHELMAKEEGFLDKLPSPDFRKMRDFLPLQAADIVAYELYKECERELYYPERDQRWGVARMGNLMAKKFPNGEIYFRLIDGAYLSTLNKDIMAMLPTMVEEFLRNDERPTKDD